jgi:diguanylate cyclase (GGDEF)-like protein
MKRLKLSTKLYVLLGISVLVLLFALGSLLFQRYSQAEVIKKAQARSTKQLIMRSQIDQARALALQLADMATPYLESGDHQRLGELARSHRNQPGVASVIVFDARGYVLHDGAGPLPSYAGPMNDDLAQVARETQDKAIQWKDDICDVTVPIFNDQGKLGGVRVSVKPTNEMKSFAEESVDHFFMKREMNSVIHWVAFTLLALLALFTAMGGLYLQRRIVKPVNELSEVSHQFALGNYEVKIPAEQRADEIGDLQRAFSQMQESVLRHNREIRRMAYTDPLTGLANRLSFRESLDERLLTLQATSGEVALLFVDLDDFKRVNDTAGHEAGDEALSQLSQRIRLVVERFGSLGSEISRFGGDEFLVLLLAEDIRSVSSELAQAIIDEVSRPFVLRGRQVFLGASIGITLFPYDARHAGQLLKNADIAMYQAKSAGKNCYRFYSRAMDQAVERRVKLEEELRGAITRSELSVVYQPLFRMSDQRVVGAEALVRWHHPHLGVVPPSVFIEVAEQTGFIEDIGRYVLEQSARDASEWMTLQQDLFVSVNMSSRQLRSGYLPDVVASTLHNCGLRPGALHMELTETAVLGDETLASGLLSRLRATGVKVWLDDFGTGFSGLSHLRRVPVDGVKVDRSFVADLLRDPDDLALTSAIIAMGHSLGITVVAEGIESEGQYNLLRERGCDIAQGFWLGRPMVQTEFMLWLRDQLRL